MISDLASALGHVMYQMWGLNGKDGGTRSPLQRKLCGGGGGQNNTHVGLDNFVKCVKFINFKKNLVISRKKIRL